jgi:hypothetical protein
MDELDSKKNDKIVKICNGCKRESKYCSCDPIDEGNDSYGGTGVGGGSYSGHMRYEHEPDTFP